MEIIENINWPDVALLPENELQRLYYGRGFCFENNAFINIDWLSPVLLIILYKEVKSSWLQSLSERLLDKLQGLNFTVKSIQVQYRCRNFAPTDLLFGEPISDFSALENGLKYQINLGRKQNYGLFLDMKKGRQWVYNNSKGKRVLNLFSYTCAFSNVAIAGDAEQVVNLDMSKAALSVGRDNHRLNNHDLSKVKYLGHDLFKSWGKIRRLGPYDLIIADPPSLQKGSVNIKRDYPKIIRRLPELLDKGGQALLCLNSPDLDFSFLEQVIIDQCPEAKIIGKVEPAKLFINREPERGLKCLLVRIN